ncbi:hypothetical protein, partial [Campylobacter concisus]|uniref:hypothetical protein n=1 Tax=Campylobacter concisus TaxID=199 RepID=UPI001F31DD55
NGCHVLFMSARNSCSNDIFAGCLCGCKQFFQTVIIDGQAPKITVLHKFFNVFGEAASTEE